MSDEKKNLCLSTLHFYVVWPEISVSRNLTEIVYHLSIEEKLNSSMKKVSTERQKRVQNKWKKEREMNLFTGHKFCIDIFLTKRTKLYDTKKKTVMPVHGKRVRFFFIQSINFLSEKDLKRARERERKSAAR